MGNYFNDKIEEFYSDGTNELRNRWKTVIVINNGGYYVEDGLIKISIKEVAFFSKEKQCSYFKQKSSANSTIYEKKKRKKIQNRVKIKGRKIAFQK